LRSPTRSCPSTGPKYRNPISSNSIPSFSHAFSPSAHGLQRRPRRLPYEREVVQELVDPPLPALVQAGHAALVEVLAEPAGPRADDHLVVVRMTSVFCPIPPMLLSASNTMPDGKRPVADHRDRVVVRPAEQLVAGLQPARSRRCTRRGRS
jgi:hypothetical protein